MCTNWQTDKWQTDADFHRPKSSGLNTTGVCPGLIELNVPQNVMENPLLVAFESHFHTDSQSLYSTFLPTISWHRRTLCTIFRVFSLIYSLAMLVPHGGESLKPNIHLSSHFLLSSCLINFLSEENEPNRRETSAWPAPTVASSEEQSTVRFLILS